MNKQFREGWMAATRLMGTMIDQGMSPRAAIVSVMAAAGEEKVQRTRQAVPFDWEAHLRKVHPSYDRPMVVEAVKRFVEYRAERKLRRWTKKTWISNLKNWATTWTPEELDRAVTASIANGWQGLFNPRGNRKGAPAKRAAEPAEPVRKHRAI